MPKPKSKNHSNHKKQAWGVLMLGLSLFLFLAIISYDVNDSISLRNEGDPVPVNNWLGPIGAIVAFHLMQWTLGYPILVLPLLILLSGLSAVQLRPTSNPLRTSIILIAWAVIFSLILAFPEAMRTAGHITEYYPSGLIGGWIASKLVIYLSKLGGLLILIVLAFLLFVLTIQIELAQIVHLIVKGFRKFFAAFANLWPSLEGKWPGKEHLQEQKIELRKKEFDTETEEPSTKPVQKGLWSKWRAAKRSEEEIPEIMVDDQLPSLQEKAGVPQRAKIPVQTSIHDILKKKQELDELKATSPASVSEEETGPFSEEMNFEVQKEHTDVELDYDALVKESIAKYQFPSIDLLNDPPENTQGVTREELKANAEFLEAKLLDFGVKAKVVKVTAGPVITLYELQPAPGVKVSSIVNLANDMALALEARGIRILAPIPGKAAVGIEIPNRNPQKVYLKSLLRSERFIQSDFELPLALGKTINGESYITDLTKMPHLLVAGSTGSGKSVGINTMIMSLLYSVNPGKVKFMMIDPKKLELSLYRDLRDHYLLWRPDLDEEVITRPNNAISILNSLTLEMDRRYDQLKKINARNIVDYNERVSEGSGAVKAAKAKQLPYLVVMVDELADLMMVVAKEIEPPIARLAGMARAVGIHLVFATQRPSVDVITGVIKANFPARIAYQVATKVDSRTVIDLNGAEQLLGNGDMLFLPPGSAKPIRLQNPFISTSEVESVIEHIRRQPKLPYYSLPQPVASKSAAAEMAGSGAKDNLYEDARAIVVQHQKGSVSLLQRRLGIGYSRAARLLDELEEDGVVGPPDGSKAREVLMTLEELNQLK